MSNKIRVLYLLGCNEGPSKRYRVFNHIEALALKGCHAEWIWDIDPKLHDTSYLSSFTVIVVFRSGYNERVAKFFALVRSLNLPLVYDIDDLVFDETVIDQIDVFRRMDPAAQIEYRAGIQSIWTAMKECQYITTSTTFLADYIEKYSGQPSWIIPFGINNRQVEIATNVPAWDKPVRFIGYLSGTNTHQNDFAEAAHALRRILDEYDDVYLKVVGFLDVEKHLPNHLDRIVCVPFMDWQDLLVETSSLYAAIAPFEMGSLFCQAKSELKFVESALCHVPIVASAVPSFAEAIENDVNGFTAINDEEWYTALKHLLDNHNTRNRIAREAFFTTMNRYSPPHIGTRLIDSYGSILERHSARTGSASNDGLPRSREKKPGLRISWIIPQPFEGSGGHRNIFRAIRNLSDFGHYCSLYVLPDNHRFANGAEVDEFIRREFFHLDAENVVLGCDNIDFCDVLICTYWTTAYIVQQNRKKSRLHVYFLQDFEPMFFPMGTDYVRAMETYNFGFHFITSGPWPLHMLKSLLGIEGGDCFRFPVDKKIYYTRSDLPLSKQVVSFFGRPDMPRRCYPLGVAALEIVHRNRPNVEIVFYGSRAEKFSNVPFPFTNLGLTDTLDELGDLYRRSTVGLCFSTTNPSLVPYEMMACGCPVVDLSVNGNDVNYGTADNCVLVAPTPEAIAAGIIDILDNREKAQRLTRNGIEYVKDFPNEVEMSRLIESSIVRKLKQTEQC